MAARDHLQRFILEIKVRLSTKVGPRFELYKVTVEHDPPVSEYHWKIKTLVNGESIGFTTMFI